MLERDSIWNAFRSVGEGACAGVFGRWATFPTEKIYLDRAKDSTVSYLNLCRYNFQPNIFFKLQTQIFAQTGLVQTVGKAASTIGVMRFVEDYKPNLPSFTKGVVISLISAPCEVATTVYGEYHKLIRFSALQKNAVTPMTAQRVFTRSFCHFTLATTLRCTWSSLLTFGAMYPTEDLIRPYFPKEAQHSLSVKLTASAMSAFMVQPFIMPVITIQARQGFNHSETLPMTLKYYSTGSNWLKLFDGTTARMVNRVTYYPIAILTNDLVKQMHNKK